MNILVKLKNLVMLAIVNYKRCVRAMCFNSYAWTKVTKDIDAWTKDWV